MRLIIPSIISKHSLLDVNSLKSDRALYKVWHITAKLSHETNLAITKLSLSLIHNTIGLGLPMFINATIRQQISIYSIGPYWYLLACTPHIWKSGVQKKNFSRAERANPVLYPHLKIRGAAHVCLCMHLFSLRAAIYNKIIVIVIGSVFWTINCMQYTASANAPYFCE